MIGKSAQRGLNSASICTEVAGRCKGIGIGRGGERALEGREQLQKVESKVGRSIWKSFGCVPRSVRRKLGFYPPSTRPLWPGTNSKMFWQLLVFAVRRFERARVILGMQS